MQDDAFGATVKVNVACAGCSGLTTPRLREGKLRYGTLLLFVTVTDWGMLVFM